MFDFFFECDLIEWDADGVPVPLIEFIPDSQESED